MNRPLAAIPTLLSAAALTAALCLPLPALAAANAGAEIRTAAEHAGFAVRADKLTLVHLHLHHSINCLGGPRGKAFDAAAGDPCKGMGNGALHDFHGGRRESRLLMQAYRLALIGVRIDRYTPAHDVARAVHALLEEAQATAKK